MFQYAWPVHQRILRPYTIHARTDTTREPKKPTISPHQFFFAFLSNFFRITWRNRASHLEKPSFPLKINNIETIPRREASRFVFSSSHVFILFPGDDWGLPAPATGEGGIFLDGNRAVFPVTFLYYLNHFGTETHSYIGNSTWYVERGILTRDELQMFIYVQ